MDAIRLRVDVFILEQPGKPGWEPDEFDKSAAHYVATLGGEVVGTVRWRESVDHQFKIERLAVQSDHRRQGVGKTLLKHVLSELRKLQPERIWAQCQVHAQRFYEGCGFHAIGLPYDHYGIQHIDMEADPVNPPPNPIS